MSREHSQRRRAARPWSRNPLAIAGLAAALLVVAGATWLVAYDRASGLPFSTSFDNPRLSTVGEQVTDRIPAQRLRAEVLSILPHDDHAFTQGLLMHEGMLYESTGLHGRSSLRAVDRESGDVVRMVELDPEHFGEGLALVANRLIQLTWQEGVALVYDFTSLKRVSTLSYTGEGWGLCFDGEQLVMSDGSSTLYFRDPESFEVRRTVTVKLDGLPLDRLNELECVGDDVYANVWLTDTIVRIEGQSGRVGAVIDASGLLAPDQRRGVDVLNGIAYDPERQTFLVTGKLWPSLFEVRFVG